MKFLKPNLLLLVALLILRPLAAMASSPTTLLQAVHANHVSRSQKRLIHRMKKLHNSLKRIDPKMVKSMSLTEAKNEYLKQFRSRKAEEANEKENQRQAIKLGQFLF